MKKETPHNEEGKVRHGGCNWTKSLGKVLKSKLHFPKVYNPTRLEVSRKISQFKESGDRNRLSSRVKLKVSLGIFANARNMCGTRKIC